MKTVKVSIIVPIYNTEIYLKECLDSLVHQTLNDIEIICVDDGSSDYSGKIVEEYALRWSTIKFIKHERNKGLSEARNSGINVASGKYIMFVDSDDYLCDKSVCERLYLLAEQENTDIVYYGYQQVDQDGINSRGKVLENSSVMYGQDYFCRIINENINKVEAWTQFFNANFLNQNSIRFLPGLLNEDALFYFISIMTAQRVIEISDLLYVYRRREGSIMHSAVSEARVKSNVMIICKVFEYWSSRTFDRQTSVAIAKFLIPRVRFVNRHMTEVGFDDQQFGLEMPEEFIYRALRGKYNCWIKMTDDQIDELSGAEKVVIIGRGAAAEDVFNILKERKVGIDLVVVSEKPSEPSFFHGVEVRTIDSIASDPSYQEAYYVIATTERYHAEIESLIKRYGFLHIIKPTDFEIGFDMA